MNSKEYVEKYMEIWKNVREYCDNFVNIEVLAAITNKIFEEMLKDVRSAEIERGRTARTELIHDADKLATKKQKYMLDRLGIAYQENITKKEASELIGKSLKK